MAIREDLVASAVTFLQDPSVASSPIENRIAFLQSKNLTQEEVDASLARASGESAPSQYSNYAPQSQVGHPQAGYGGFPQYQWQQPPPAVPKRDWRDWFIMATVMGGVGYGMYVVAKRYVVPLIAPPTPPQLEQDKQAIDESFEKAFSLLDQLAKDTEFLKASEEARTSRLDTAVGEFETAVSDLRDANKRREDDSRRINDEIRGLRDLIPKAMESQKENTDLRLQELNTELKSLKKLMGQRIGPTPTAPAASPYGRYPGTAAAGAAPQSQPSVPQPSANAPLASPVSGSASGAIPKPASVSNINGTEATATLQARSSSPFSAGVPSGRAAIPAWQMAAAKKADTSTEVSVDAGSSLQEASES